MSDASVKTLEERIQALEDKLAVYEVLAAYGQSVDGGATEQARGLFAEDGVIDSGSGDRGRDRVAEIAEIVGAMTAGFAHVAYLPIVVVDGDRATAFGQTNSLQQQGDEYKVIKAAADRWELRRVDGRWYVERRTARVLLGDDESKAILAQGAAARRVMTIEDLSRRLQLLEDERAITDVLSRYSNTFDSGDESGWIDCYTADGELLHGRSATEIDMSLGAGHDTLLAFFRGQHPLQFVARHIVSQPRIVVDGDRATCSAYWVVLSDMTGRLDLFGTGRYFDDFVRDSDGQWRLRRRITSADALNLPEGK